MVKTLTRMVFTNARVAPACLHLFKSLCDIRDSIATSRPPMLDRMKRIEDHPKL